MQFCVMHRTYLLTYLLYNAHADEDKTEQIKRLQDEKLLNTAHELFKYLYDTRALRSLWTAKTDKKNAPWNIEFQHKIIFLELFYLPQLCKVNGIFTQLRVNVWSSRTENKFYTKVKDNQGAMILHFSYMIPWNGWGKCLLTKYAIHA